MRRLTPIIVLLALALFIQNTCPHGYAGKTTVARSCDHCELKQQHAPLPGSEGGVAASASSAHFPLFVFSLPMTDHAFQPGPRSVVEPAVADRYTDAAPDELLRPPRS